MLFCIRTWKNLIQFLAILLMGLIPMQGLAQKMREPDFLIEASMYAARAREQMACSLEDAERWSRKSIETARKFRSNERAERDLAGAFLARAEMLSAEIRRKRDRIRDMSRLLEKLVDQKRLQSAKRLLTENSDLACQPEIRNWQSTVQARSAEVRSLINRGDGIVQYDPKKAMQFYRDAQTGDVELAVIGPRIDHAKAVKRSMGGGHKGAAIFVTFLLAAAVGGAIYADQAKRKRQAAFGR